MRADGHIHLWYQLTLLVRLHETDASESDKTRLVLYNAVNTSIRHLSNSTQLGCQEASSSWDNGDRAGPPIVYLLHESRTTHSVPSP